MKNNKFNLIAEISANHNGSLVNAKKLIKMAKNNGADTVKIQTFEADDMTLNCSSNYFKIKKGIWKNYNIYDLYKKAHTPYNWFPKLKNYAKKIGIKLFTSVFDIRTVDFLEKNNCAIYKIASFEITHLPLIERVSKTKKPIILSTGMSSLREIEEAYNCAIKAGCKDVSLLYCVSNYPSKIEDFQLDKINILKKRFGCKVGLSDHSNDPIVAFTAVSMGAEILEKHIILSHKNETLDGDFSIDGKELRDLSENIKKIILMKQKIKQFDNSSDKINHIFRRSIFASKNINKGEIFNLNNVKIIRPNYGLSPKNIGKIIGRKSKKKINFGEPIKKEDIN